MRTSVADPEVAEPVVLAEDKLVILGKVPGRTTLGIWDDEGGVVVISVVVGANRAPVFGHRRIPVDEPIQPAAPLALTECAQPAVSGALANPGQLTATPSKSDQAQELAATAQSQLKKSPALPSRSKVGDFTSEGIIRWGDDTVVVASGFNTTRTKKTIDLLEKQSRFFCTPEKLTRVNTADPSIAEPIVMQPQEFVLLGKSPGTTQLEILTDRGTREAFDLKVGRPIGPPFSIIRSFFDDATRIIGLARATLHAPPVTNDTVATFEQDTTERIDLTRDQARFFRAEHALVRTYVANPDYADVGLISSKKLFLLGKKAGWTTIMLWDEIGNVGKFDVHVSQDPMTPRRPAEQFSSTGDSSSPALAVDPSADAALAQEVEMWSGTRKDVRVFLPDAR